MSPTNRHPSFDRLADFAEGGVAPDDSSQLGAHVRDCRRCAEDVAWLGRTLGIMRADRLEEPPPHVLARAARLMRQRAGAHSEESGPLRRLVAALRFDSAGPGAGLAFGVRGADQGTARQLLFAVGDREIEVRLQQRGTQWAVAGQVFGPCDGAEVTLSGPVDARSSLNELCEFALPPVPAGSYALLLRSADMEIEIPGLTFGV